jgi:hypothetical protein
MQRRTAAVDRLTCRHSPSPCTPAAQRGSCHGAGAVTPLTPLWRRGQLAPGHAARLALRPRETAINSAIDHRASLRPVASREQRQASEIEAPQPLRDITAAGASWPGRPRCVWPAPDSWGTAAGYLLALSYHDGATNAICLPTQPWIHCPVTLGVHARQATTTGNPVATLQVQLSGSLGSMVRLRSNLALEWQSCDNIAWTVKAASCPCPSLHLACSTAERARR